MIAELHPRLPRPQLSMSDAKREASSLPRCEEMACVGQNADNRWQVYYGDRHHRWVGPAFSTAADALLLCRVLNDRDFLPLVGKINTDPEAKRWQERAS